MKLINAWCPLCIRKICLGISKFFGIKKQKDATQLNEDETETKGLTDHDKDITICDTRESQASHQSQKQHHNHQHTTKKAKETIKITTQELFDNENQVLLEDRQAQHSIRQKISASEQSDSNNINKRRIEESVEQIKTDLLISMSNFKVCLQPHQKYYDLMQVKCRLLNERLRLNHTIVHTQPTSNNLIIRHAQPDKLNIFLYSFKLPCSYSLYNSMLNDYSILKVVDHNIDEYKMLEFINNNTKVNYLSYKKLQVLSPRDFVSLKYSYSEGNEHWDLTFSVPHELSRNIVRGEIVLSLTKVTDIPEGIKVEVYSEVDMKMTVNPRITKTQSTNEIKKYVYKCQQYVQKNFEKEPQQRNSLIF